MSGFNPPKDKLPTQAQQEPAIKGIPTVQPPPGRPGLAYITGVETFRRGSSRQCAPPQSCAKLLKFDRRQGGNDLEKNRLCFADARDPSGSPATAQTCL